MTLVPINAANRALSGLPDLRRALADLPEGARITVMIHGFKFAPGKGVDCPHRHILSLEPLADQPRAISWPKHLRIGRENLGIAFGWQASRTLWHAWAEAERAGHALARLIDIVGRDGRRVDIIGHSLGARVALSAIRQAGAGTVGKAILIAPAEFRQAAEMAMVAPAGRTVRVLNVTSYENHLFDRLLEWLVAPHMPGMRSLGDGMRRSPPNWTDLRIGDAAVLEALEGFGHRIGPPVRRICHWSGYLRPGLFPLYRAILSDSLPLAQISAALPDRAPRSRLVDRLAEVLPLPFARKAPL